jgi:thiamine-phosphate pyrophosphorylase
VLSAAEFDALGPEPLAAVIGAGIDWLQVRERQRSGRELLALVEQVQRAAQRAAEPGGRRAQVLVNRRVDVALASGAAGVHLGFDAMAASCARALLGESGIIGVACHTPAEVAAAEDANYTHLAPIFTPLSKAPNREPLGLAALTRAASGGRNVLAQGGITPDNAGACVAAGASGVAVTGAILGADDPAQACAALRAALDAR